MPRVTSVIAATHRHDRPVVDTVILDFAQRNAQKGTPEPLIEVRAADVAGLSRLAWHLGDRHVPVQVLPNRIRTRRDEAIEILLRSLGAKIMLIDAPFEPEGGAYASMHGHGHDHDHAHDLHHGH